jgi:hypothetical protein
MPSACSCPIRSSIFRIDGHCHVVVNDLEVNRMRKRARHCRVISYNQCLEKLRRKVKRPGLATVISFLLRERHLRKIFVPANFPLGLARDLRNYRIKVRVKKDGVFPQREFKCGRTRSRRSARP